MPPAQPTLIRVASSFARLSQPQISPSLRSLLPRRFHHNGGNFYLRSSSSPILRLKPSSLSSSLLPAFSFKRYRSDVALNSPPTNASLHKSCKDETEAKVLADEPEAFELTFTCKPCSTRSIHRISKQGYYHGTVLVECPGCQTRHLVADNLNIFAEGRQTFDMILEKSGQVVKKGVQVRQDGQDVELWDDGTVVDRKDQRLWAALKADREADEPPKTQDTEKKRWGLTEEPSSQK